MALQEKLGNLVVVSRKVEDDQARLEAMGETVKDLQGQMCALSELVKKGQEVGTMVIISVMNDE